MFNHLVLFEQEGEQHQHSSIVDNPPHVNVAICEAFMVAWVKGHIFGDHQSQVGSCGAANCVWAEMTTHWLRHLHIWTPFTACEGMQAVEYSTTNSLELITNQLQQYCNMVCDQQKNIFLKELQLNLKC